MENIGFTQYTQMLVEQGFEDLETLKTIMDSSMPLTHSVLKKAGIRRPGHRARILVRLEFGKFTFINYQRQGYSKETTKTSQYPKLKLIEYVHIHPREDLQEGCKRQ